MTCLCEAVGHPVGVSDRLTEQLREATRAQSRLRPVEPRPDSLEVDNGKGGGPFGWISVVAILVILVVGWLVIHQLQDDSKLQDCVMSGRRNCAPVDTTR